MRKTCFALVLVTAGLLPTSVHAQATRTWVSGVGDDANPCSRTAPCKTFAGAISKTAVSGEIDTLDPGGFGAVTITKAMTIDASAGLGGVLVSGTNGIIINAAGADVTLRDLDINGVGSGISGILILAAGTVRVENCKIYGFANRGIDDERSTGALFVSNTTINNNTQTGILGLSSGGSTLRMNLDHVQMHDNGNAAFAITGGTQAVVANSWASSNGIGFYAESGAILNIDNSEVFGNGTGIYAWSTAVVKLYNSTVTSNSTGLVMSGGSVVSYGLNRIFGNTAGNGPPTSTLPLQ